MSGTPDTTTPAVTEEDRAKAAELLTVVRFAGPTDRMLARASVAAALAAERGKADALRADVHAEIERLEANAVDGQTWLTRQYVIARLRAIADGQR